MAKEAPDQSGGDVAVLDEAVLDALGQLQGKYDAEFVTRMITMFMERALALLIRLKEGVGSGDIAALRHASHELSRAARQSEPTRLLPIANDWN
jgi:HPt (histidine-containing phosphotransfer) domain-containing protein